jgi:hypothetical protein
MKLTPRKDKPCEPTISASECGAGLQLVRHILGRIVESGHAPEQVVERAHEFELYLETLTLEGKVFLKREDWASLNAVILAGSLPTLRSTRGHRNSAKVFPFWN